MTETLQSPIICSNSDSRLEWRGLTSCKFHLAERHHFDTITKSLQEGDLTSRGRKHFEAYYGKDLITKFCLKPFPELQNKQSDMGDPKSFRDLAYVPPQKKVSNKSFKSLTRPSHTKTRSLVMPSNFVSIKNLKLTPIDKAALIKFTSSSAGATANIKVAEAPATTREYNRVNKLNWNQRDKLQERLEDIRVVKSLSIWENQSVQQVDQEGLEGEENKGNQDRKMSHR